MSLSLLDCSLLSNRSSDHERCHAKILRFTVISASDLLNAALYATFCLTFISLQCKWGKSLNAASNMELRRRFAQSRHYKTERRRSENDWQMAEDHRIIGRIFTTGRSDWLSVSPSDRAIIRPPTVVVALRGSMAR